MYRFDFKFVWKYDTFCLYIREEWEATVQNPQYHKVSSKQIFLNNVKISLDRISVHFAALHLQTLGYSRMNVIYISSDDIVKRKSPWSMAKCQGDLIW